MTEEKKEYLKKGIFDDKTMRNEMLEDKVKELFKEEWRCRLKMLLRAS